MRLVRTFKNRRSRLVAKLRRKVLNKHDMLLEFLILPPRSHLFSCLLRCRDRCCFPWDTGVYPEDDFIPECSPSPCLRVLVFCSKATIHCNLLCLFSQARSRSPASPRQSILQSSGRKVSSKEHTALGK